METPSEVKGASLRLAPPAAQEKHRVSWGLLGFGSDLPSDALLPRTGPVTQKLLALRRAWGERRLGCRPPLPSRLCRHPALGISGSSGRFSEPSA